MADFSFQDLEGGESCECMSEPLLQDLLTRCSATGVDPSSFSVMPSAYYQPGSVRATPFSYLGTKPNSPGT